MHNKNFQTFFDCGSSKIRAGIFNKTNLNKVFYTESNYFKDHSNLDIEIQKIISSFEKNTNEYIDNVNLMIDSSKMLSIAISISKKLDGSKLKEANVQFLIQETKQQILKYYADHNIVHIIINNYKIDDIYYSYLPHEIKCNFISLDITFICIPSDLVLYFKNIFLKSNISINQIICASYAKAINYKNNLNLNGYVSFIDVGFKKTSIISFSNNKIISFDVLPIGGNHITKDISKILEIDLESAEKIKINFDKNQDISNSPDVSIKTLEKIIFARTEEIFELCAQSIKSNSLILSQFKLVLVGEGSKILDNDQNDKISSLSSVVFLEETLEDICQSGFKFGKELNKQEVVMVPKKLIKQGFFEKLFHLFS